MSPLLSPLLLKLDLHNTWQLKWPHSNDRQTSKKEPVCNAQKMAHYSFSAHFQVGILHSEQSLAQELLTILISLFATPPSRGRSEAPTTMSRSSTPAGSVFLPTILPLFDLFSRFVVFLPHGQTYSILAFAPLATCAQILLQVRVTNSSTCIHLTEARTHERARERLWSIVQPRNGEQETR